MKNNKPQVFLSYCRADVEPHIIEYIFLKLQELCGNKIEVLFDNELQAGDDLHTFMDQLQFVDSTIVILTPSYKVKVLQKDGGVWNEYRKIVERMERNNENGGSATKSGEHFEVIPLLLSGDYSTAVPTEIQTKLFHEIKELKFLKSNAHFPRNHERTVLTTLKKISEKLLGNAEYNNPNYKKTWEDFYRELFQESKSEWYKEKYQEYIDTLFVKTDVFNKVRNQEIWFIVGRKGSGKSTITDVLPLIDTNKYIATIPIYAENISLLTTYNIFTSKGDFISDSKNVYPRLRLFQFGWEVFIYLTVIYKIVEKHHNNKLSFIKVDSVRKLRTFMKTILTRERISDEEDFNVLFNHAFGKLQEYVAKSIGHSRASNYPADLTSPMAINEYRNFIFSKDVIKTTHDIMRQIDRKILLSFDGIDTIFDNFRKENIRHNVQDAQDRANFEVDWLNSLLLLVLNQGIHRNDISSVLYSNLHYCITIPKDRFLEVREADRDTFRHHGRFAPLNWSGIELAIFLRKRLEMLEKGETNKNLTPKERLSEILSTKYANVPESIEFDFNGRRYEMPLFLYVLRHTFWRPRDLLFYYASILTLVKELKNKKKEITTEKLRHVIRITTTKVILGEFITEFKSTLKNINLILNAFKRKKQILDYGSLSTILSQIDFELITGIIEDITFTKKLEFLYQIGFLGVIVKEKHRDQNYMIHKYAFIFNESSHALDQLINGEELQETEYVIHPIFCEYLFLDTKDNQEMVLVFDWEYLDEKEILRNVTQDF